MAANEIFKINVYDKEGNIIKTSTAVDCDLKFGAIRKIMALLEIEDINDVGALLKTVYGAWDQVIKVLSECFPDMTDDDWDNVKVNELIPTTVALVKAMIAKMLTIPTESKN
jgi:hypothetical protein